jgi:predicted nuclease of predicted toxin-antitoxin system
MKFIVDAQLPLSLKMWLKKQGHDVIHTRDLPRENFTVDSTVIDIADREDRIVITKDSDFLKAYLLKGKPQRILMITTGNIVNKELIHLFELNFIIIESYFKNNCNIIELNNASIIVHE